MINECVDKPYGDTFYAELDRLHTERTRAAESYAAQMLYLRMGGCYDHDTPRRRREKIAELAAQEWMRLTAEIEALNAAEYARKQTVDLGVSPRYREEQP